MIAWLIVMAVLVLLALLPLGLYARYDEQGPVAAIVAGPVQIPVYPPKPKDGKKKKQKKTKKEPAKAKKKAAKGEQKAAAEPKPKQKLGGKIQEFMPFVRLGLDLLGCFFRKLRVPKLTLHVQFGGANDAAKAAINYGRAWAAIGAIMPPLRNKLRIREENVSASCDFTDDTMRVYAELKATFLLGDLIAMGVRYGVRALVLLIKYKKNKSTQINNHSKKAVQTNESSSS